MDSRTYRAAPSAYGIFGAIMSAISVLWLIAVWRVDAPRGLLLLPVAGFALVALWLSRFRLTIGAEELVIGLPFRRVRLARGDVLSVEFAEERGGKESPVILCIRTSFGQEVRLNARIFSTDAIQRLLAVPVQRAGAAAR